MKFKPNPAAQALGKLGGKKCAPMVVRKALQTAEPHLAYLYEAVARYVEHHHGNVIVAGGPEIQEWPGDPKFNFRIAVKCTGIKPVYEA